MNSFQTTQWYAIHTKPRQEDRASTNLATLGIEILAPRIPVKKMNPGFEPLFPGYIFARFSIDHMLKKVRFTRGVSGVVSFGGLPSAVEDGVIVSIKEQTDQRGIIRSTTDIVPGDKLLIVDGPLRNFAGLFERELPASMRIRILLTTIAFSARIEVSKVDVIRLGSA